MSRKEEEFVRDWLTGSGSREDVEKEIQETVFVLSPKRAPHPRKNIDQLFSTLRGGPLAPLPQEDVHEDVEMLFSGVQTSSAVPKGDISDVLDSLREGPLSASTDREVRQEDSNVVPLRRSWSVWGTVVAVAAVILLLVQPVLYDPMMLSEDSKSVHQQQYMSFSVEEEAPKEEDIDEPMLDGTKKSVQPKREEHAKKSPAPARKTVRKQGEIKPQESPATKKRKGSVDSSVGSDPAARSTLKQSEERLRMELRERFEESALEDPEPASMEDRIAGEAREDRKESDNLALSLLRAEALQDSAIPRHPPFASLDREALIAITQDVDVQKLYWAAYELAIRFPQERKYIESLLRLKGTPSAQQKYLLVLLGDLYRDAGAVQQARQAYLRALKTNAR